MRVFEIKSYRVSTSFKMESEMMYFYFLVSCISRPSSFTVALYSHLLWFSSLMRPAVRFIAFCDSTIFVCVVKNALIYADILVLRDIRSVQKWLHPKFRVFRPLRQYPSLFSTVRAHFCNKGPQVTNNLVLDEGLLDTRIKRSRTVF